MACTHMNAARSNTWVCSRSLAEITGSNPTGAWMSVSCDYYMSRADHSSRGVLPSMVSECDRKASIMGKLWPTAVVVAQKIYILMFLDDCPVPPPLHSAERFYKCTSG